MNYKEPRIELISEKKLIGKRLTMTLSNDRTPELWKSFMHARKQIQNTVTTDLLCMQVFDPSLGFKDFTLTTPFEKWAVAEVDHFNIIPQDMESHILKGGLYAVFDYVGRPIDFAPMFEFIFRNWIPQSEYEVDRREHFEVLGAKYKNNDPTSEEEIWIPIKRKENR